MKTKLAALMPLSGVVVHSLLLLTLQDEPRGSSGPVGRNEFKMNNWGTNSALRCTCGMYRVPCTLAGRLAQSPRRTRSAINQLRICYNDVKVGCVLKLHYVLCEKKVGFPWVRFVPWASIKKQSSTSTVRNS